MKGREVDKLKSHEQLVGELESLRKELAVLQSVEAERKRVGEQLRQSRARLEGLIGSAMDAIITIDDSQNITLFNTAAEQMFRCSATEAIGRPLDRFIPERFRTAHRDYVHTFGLTNVTTRQMGALGAVTGLRANGEEFAAEASISQLAIDGQKLYTVILRDITRRQQMEEALQKERDFISAVLQTVSTLVTVLDREGRILQFNRACEQTTGYSFEEVKGKHVWDLFLIPEEVEPVRAVFEQLRGGQFQNKYENYWRTKEGLLRLISWSNTTILDTQGSVEYVIGTGLDITELKHTQEQLRSTERLAELGTLASGMAHEIGTPMNVILGRAEYLMRRTEDGQTKKGLETIVTQVERITRIMNQLLTFARRRPSERRPIDLGQTIQECLEVLRERMARHHIQVKTEFEPSIGPIHADPDHMSQVFLNLFINAIHAMPEGGTLGINLAVDGSQVRLEVSDSGCGIPKDDLPKIFDPFFTTKEAGKGTGLGLTVVHGIMQEHGGLIEVASELGHGTTFTLTLPAYSPT